MTYPPHSARADGENKKPTAIATAMPAAQGVSPSLPATIIGFAEDLWQILCPAKPLEDRMSAI